MDKMSIGVAALVKAKLLTMGPALVGALLMAMFRPPKSRKEMAMQAVVALGCSFMFGPLAYTLLNNWLQVGDDLKIAVYALVGSLSWGLFGGLAHLRDRVAEDPIQVAKDVKDLL